MIPQKTNSWLTYYTNIFKNSYFLTLLSIPVFVFLHNLNEFRDLIFLRNIVILVMGWTILPFLIYILINKITRLHKQQSLLLTLYLTACFFFFGAVQDFFHKYSLLLFFSKSYFLIPFFICVPLISWQFFREKNTLVIINYVKGLFFLLVIYEVVVLFSIILSSASYKTISSGFKHQQINPISNNTVKQKPDIYHFVFDSYTNSKTLKKYWNYRNPLDSFLINRGFYVANDSRSNYDFTPFSLAATFNLQYLSNTKKYLRRDGKNLFIGRLAYMENELFGFLESNGYTLNNFSPIDSIEYLTRMGTLGPQNPVTWMRNQTFERFYLNPWIRHKLLHKLYHSNIPPDLVKYYNAYIDYHQKALNKISYSVANSNNSMAPRFTFVHFLIPHEPYVFDENGKVDLQRTSKSDDMQLYLTQLKYTNKIIEKIVNLLITDSKKKIIIIQGDHGYRNYRSSQIPRETQFESFNAIYFYDLNYKSMHKEISLVNTYRIVLNNYFNYELSLLKDSIFLNQR